ncbi:uncharacterized protein DS421_2g54080 [Arachis hypogaea]|nr:uncharacterized protein DS421_2g54080 [Arachis hypogaea]
MVFSPCRARSCGVAGPIVVPKPVSIVVVGWKKTFLSPREPLSSSPFSLCPRPRSSSLTVNTIPPAAANHRLLHRLARMIFKIRS